MAKRRRSNSKREVEAPVFEIPHDPFNESVVIAAGAKFPEARKQLFETIKPDLLHGDGHSEIWAAVTECVRRDLEPTPESIRQIAGDSIDEAYLKQLYEMFDAAPKNLRHHIDELLWGHARYEAVRGPISEFLRAIKDTSSSPERVHALALSIALSLDGYSAKHHLLDPNLVVTNQMSEIRRRRQQAVYAFGIDGLDQDKHGEWRIVPGAAPGKVTTVTAISGSGKSTLTAIVALAQARMKRRVLYCPWEMGEGLTLELLATISLGWSRHKVAVGDLDDEEEQQFELRMRQISAYVRFAQNPFGRKRGTSWTNDEALDAIHGFVADSGCEVAIFDLWKRGMKDDEPSEEESALYRTQTIADETKVHFILCQQQRLKDIEKRGDKRPTREGIKGSSAWVDVSDTILGVHLPSKWKNVADDTLEIDILKQRYGRWPLAIEFDWDPDKVTLKNGREVQYNETDADGNNFDAWMKNAKKDRAGAKQKSKEA